MFAGLITALAGAAICVYITLMHSFGPSRFVGGEINQKVIGNALMGTEKYQYLLPFEVISVLLLTLSLIHISPAPWATLAVPYTSGTPRQSAPPCLVPSTTR